MIANDFLRKIRYSLNLKDKEMIQIFQASGQEMQQVQLNTLLKKEDEKGFVLCSHSLLNAFLDGLIVFYRGSLEKGPAPDQPVKINNNDMLRKVRIALAYQDTDMLEVFRLAGIKISKSELSAFFRRSGHKHYKECGDQFLRNFLQGLALYKKRPVRRDAISIKEDV
ncbi:MAG: DUF1456 family protein [Proteobacteria bacterium]|nr:DUF1456 family protein [Pseudomonadota bacterium]MBU1137408.1 DUF1456 family protein [Pseudomonadota bacterium]MBU1234592.1 DUF1456 family protein [Pseudomonadota bacterium]MBU1420318.1 DUF1456 family protein [Pseudomonadota bacterium]MBU1453472.1 DUF1456 family protein [Pseudomonadota bacterium]